MFTGDVADNFERDGDIVGSRDTVFLKFFKFRDSRNLDSLVVYVVFDILVLISFGLTPGSGERTRIVGSLVVILTGSVVADSFLACKGKSCTHPVWQNPCGLRNRAYNRKRYFAHENEISPNGLKHPSTRPLRRMRTQLRITYNHFRSGQLQRDIALVYSGVKNLLTEEFVYEWLPSHQLAWYRDTVKCLDKKTKMEVLLPRLHEALQNFSATFEELRHYGGESHHSDHQEILSTRRHVLSEISHEIKKLLCEVETTILNVGLRLPDSLPTEAGSLMIWDVTPDHTGGLIQDWGVLAAYQSFLDDWLKIVRRLVGNKSNQRCKLRHSKKTSRKKLRPDR